MPKVSEDLHKNLLDSLEIKVGILQIAEVLSFLHNSAQMALLELTPEVIFIAKDGKWKLCTLPFALQLKDTATAASFSWDEKDITPPLNVFIFFDFFFF